MTYSHHYSIIQECFLCLKNPLCSQRGLLLISGIKVSWSQLLTLFSLPPWLWSWPAGHSFAGPRIYPPGRPRQAASTGSPSQYFISPRSSLSKAQANLPTSGIYNPVLPRASRIPCGQTETGLKERSPMAMGHSHRCWLQPRNSETCVPLYFCIWLRTAS